MQVIARGHFYPCSLYTSEDLPATQAPDVPLPQFPHTHLNAAITQHPNMPTQTLTKPGWPEICAALVTYVVLILLLGLWMVGMPEEQAATRGIAGMAVNGVAGTAALLVAYILRIRDFRAFGFCAASARWLLIGAALGVVAVGLSFVIEHVYFSFVTEPNTQGDFQAAAKAGVLSLLILVISGAILTPLGEEFVFRGVVANGLNRYGWWPGVVGSAIIFGAVHGPSVIFFNAVMAGILTGILFRKTESLWPGVMVHVVYNGIWLIIYSLE